MRPLVESVQTPLSACGIYRLFHRQPYSVFLDSSLQHPQLGRYSLMGVSPFLVFRSRGSSYEIRTVEKTETGRGNPWPVLQSLLNRYRVEEWEPVVPMACGGAMGYLAYDLGRHLEKIPNLAEDDLKLPDAYLGFYDLVIVIDHQAEKTFLVSTGHPEGREEAARRRAFERLKTLQAWIEKGERAGVVARSGQTSRKAVEGVTSNFTKDAYCRMVERAQEYIAAGDIYQVNLSQRLTTGLPCAPFELYQTLRRINPAPFAGYLNFPGLVVASASPERFLRVHKGRVETRPIKGTRPRGRTEGEDLKLREELLNSQKDRAELVMIVDLERNDLSRVCRPGTVRTPRLFELEQYATVYHLVATVVGELKEGKDVLDLLMASFPGGSITGAPKIRAMEIIEELEPVRRGIYTGSIGYLAFNGDADLNIAIRTFVIKGNRVFFQVGGGIVADSDPAAEYQETLDKARALLWSLGQDAPAARETGRFEEGLKEG